MPKKIDVLNVFVASPSDVAEERSKLEDVLASINKKTGDDFNVILNLIKWETHSYPGVGKEPQEFINSQMPEYDIFIGIFWHRIGTATKNYISGSVEEFNIALDRYTNKNSDIKILLYFKEAPISPSEIDINQFQGVVDFKKQIKEKALYYQFKDISEFEKSVELHLYRILREWRSQLNSGEAAKDKNGSTDNEKEIENKIESVEYSDNSYDFLGEIDYIEIMSSKFSNITNSVNRIASATSELSNRINERTAEINMLSTLQKSGSPVSMDNYKKIIFHTAQDMESFVNKARPEINNYSTEFEIGFDAIISLTKIYNEDVSGVNKIQIIKDQVSDLIPGISYAIESVEKFKQSAIRLPRVLKEFNVRKKEVIDILDIIIFEFQKSQRLMRDFLSIYSSY